MNILAIDSSAVTAGCAVLSDGRTVSSGFVNIGLTHSQTLLPLIDRTLAASALQLADIDCVAVSAGPGSFTGVRIGVAAAKGIAFRGNIPCAAVSTLEAIAYGAAGLSGICCAVMDARREQVYNALFRLEYPESVTRLTDDRAISIADLCTELEGTQGTIWLCGDGAELCMGYMSSREKLAERVLLAPEPLRRQSGIGVARAAQGLAESGSLTDGERLVPSYLRLPQAERELSSRQAGLKKS